MLTDFPCPGTAAEELQSAPRGPWLPAGDGQQWLGDVAGSPLAFKSQTSVPCVVARAAAAKDHRQHGLNSRHLRSHSSEGCKVQSEVRQRCFWCGPAVWLADGHLFAVSSQGGESEPQGASGTTPHKDTSPIGSAPLLQLYLTLITYNGEC